MVKLTTVEAEELIKQLKCCLENEIRFPHHPANFSAKQPNSYAQNYGSFGASSP